MNQQDKICYRKKKPFVNIKLIKSENNKLIELKTKNKDTVINDRYNVSRFGICLYDVYVLF